jgi:hypothetical protein
VNACIASFQLALSFTASHQYTRISFTLRGQIVCPFHGRGWNLDGIPAGLYGGAGFEQRMLDPEDLKLIECQVDAWGNCVFINMDLAAPPLMNALDPMPSVLDPFLLLAKCFLPSNCRRSAVRHIRPRKTRCRCTDPRL